MPAGASYTRKEQFRLPSRNNDVYRVVVRTNYSADLFFLESGLYEHTATQNNSLVDDGTLAIAVRPRPDLQVQQVVVPPAVDPGGTIQVDFTVANLGTAATSSPFWRDNIYLSLDSRLDGGDLLMQTIGNQSALDPAATYRTISDPIVIPERFRGNAYVIVTTEATSVVDEWPNDSNNSKVVPILVRPQPLPDLVTSRVVAPAQAVEGATIEVRYTVTNLGPGLTPVENWTDTIWLTKDKNRPHPGQGDRQLKSLAHVGRLDRNAGYDIITTVTLPTGLVSGTYYITPWSDSYDAVLEDTLAQLPQLGRKLPAAKIFPSLFGVLFS